MIILPLSLSSSFFRTLTLTSPSSPISKYNTKQKRISTIQFMFTGIVEEMGQIRHLGPAPSSEGFDLKIYANIVLEGFRLSDSIAVNGTCLTVSQFDLDSKEFSVGVAPETLRKTSLTELKSGSPVNLERALQPTSRMGGHFVQGHMDCTGEMVSVTPEKDSLWVKVKDKEVMKYIMRKGFITVDGTSLTVVNVYEEECCFDFMLVAYSQMNVVIPMKNVGEKVNLEVDILGKYVEKLLKSAVVVGSSS